MIEAGGRAPDFMLETPDGDAVRLSDEYRARTILLVFFKEECPACRVAIPRVPRFGQSYTDLGVWTISQDDPATTREFLVESAPSLQVLVDAPEYEASRAFGVEAVPAFLLVGRDGTILEAFVGWDRDRFNSLSKRAASELGQSYHELVGDGDGPDYRPG